MMRREPVEIDAGAICVALAQRYRGANQRGRTIATLDGKRKAAAVGNHA